VIVYEMLTGEAPFKGNIYTLISQHIEAPPPPLQKKQRDIPNPVARLVMSALAKNPTERPRTAMAFATALRSNIEGEIPILREALDLYRKHFSAFFCISRNIYFALMIILLLLYGALSPLKAFAAFLYEAQWLLSLMLILFANTVNTAACSLVVR